jgi:hypothetical protein
MNLIFLEYSLRISKRNPFSLKNPPFSKYSHPRNYHGFIEKEITFMEIISSFWKSLQTSGVMADSIDTLNKVNNLLFSLNSVFLQMLTGTSNHNGDHHYVHPSNIQRVGLSLMQRCRSEDDQPVLLKKRNGFSPGNIGSIVSNLK